MILNRYGNFLCRILKLFNLFEHLVPVIASYKVSHSLIIFQVNRAVQVIKGSIKLSCKTIKNSTIQIMMAALLNFKTCIEIQDKVFKDIYICVNRFIGNGI